MFLSGFERWLAYMGRRGKNYFDLPITSVISLATRTIKHQPEERAVLPPPIALAGNIERVTGTEHGTLADEIENSLATVVIHTATILHMVENVTIDNGYVYKGLTAEYVSNLGHPKFQVEENLNERILTSTSGGSGFFGDWAVDDNLLEFLATEVNLEPIRIQPHANYGHKDDLTRIFGIQDTYVNCVTNIRNLIITDDSGYNSNKVSRIALMRKKVFNHIRHPSISPPVYLCRGRGGYRSKHNLTNEKEIIEFLSKIGFQILVPEELSVTEILEKIYNTPLAIGIEGSQLTYALFALRESGTLITLQPPSRFKSSFRPRCESIGIHWGFLVGMANANGFEVPIDELKRLLELCS